MLCEGCGYNIEENMKFCPFCGANIDKTAKRIKATQKFEIDQAMKEKNFDFIWDKILNEKNTYAEYQYTKFFRKVIDRIMRGEDFQKCTKKILALGERGYAYPYYLYGQSKVWFYRANSASSQEGVKIVLKMAELGQPSAESVVGVWCENGQQGQIRNSVKAYKMIKDAADKLHPNAMYSLAEAYKKEELGLKRNEQLEIKYMERAAFFGEENAVKELGEYDTKSIEAETTDRLAEKYRNKLNFDALGRMYKPLSQEEQVKAESVFNEIINKK